MRASSRVTPHRRLSSEVKPASRALIVVFYCIRNVNDESMRPVEIISYSIDVQIVNSSVRTSLTRTEFLLRLRKALNEQLSLSYCERGLSSLIDIPPSFYSPEYSPLISTYLFPKLKIHFYQRSKIQTKSFEHSNLNLNGFEVVMFPQPFSKFIKIFRP